MLGACALTDDVGETGSASAALDCKTSGLATRSGCGAVYLEILEGETRQVSNEAVLAWGNSTYMRCSSTHV